MRALFPARPLRAAAFGLLLWFSGMVVGSIVFATPQLEAARPIQYLTANPFITVPIIPLWTILAWAFSRGSVSRAPEPREEGIRIGLVFLAVNVLMDLLLMVGVMHVGASFYSYAGLWLAYLVLVAVPWLTGRAALAARRPIAARA
jgi:uncharacterized membrane protein (DUF441 family)